MFLLVATSNKRFDPYRNRPLQEQICLWERYRWSSLEGYWDGKKKQAFVKYDNVLEQVGDSRKKYREFIIDGIKRGYTTPWDRVQGQVVLGEEKFVERIKKEVEEKGAKREQPGVRQLQAKSPGDVLKAVARYYGALGYGALGTALGSGDGTGVTH